MVYTTGTWVYPQYLSTYKYRVTPVTSNSPKRLVANMPK